MSISFGQVPHPPYQNRIITNSTAWDNLGPRTIVGTCVHRMVGTLWGTDGYFRGEALNSSLTDYGIGGALDGSDDGTIFMWNDPHGSRTPWANGWGSESPDFDRNGQAYYDIYGSASKGLVSIELSGQPDTPVTAKQFEALCQLMAHHHDAAGVPWDLFPRHPVSNVITSLEHFEFAAKECPFSVVRNLRDQYLNRVQEIMRVYQTGQGGTPVTFARNDKIRVFDGPLNLRASASTASAVVTSLSTGTDLCVLDGPTPADGYAWYNVSVIGSATTGWVAGEFCTFVAAAGCASGGPTPLPTSGVLVGDLLEVSDGPLNLRASASTSAAILVALPTGARGVVVGGPTNANGYTWHQIDTHDSTNTYRGWIAAPFVAEVTAGLNRLANPTAETNLNNIVPMNAESTLDRLLVNGSYVVRCTNSGGGTMEGVKYSSAALSLPGPRFFSGVVDAYGTGVIDAMRVRVMYADGSASLYSSNSPSVTLSNTAWKRVYTPIVAADPAKTVSKVELWIRRSSAVAQTFYVDNARVIEY